MRTIGVAERRVRLARRHFLIDPAPDIVTLAGQLVGLHSSDPVTVYLTAWARIAGFVRADLEAALYEKRSVLRMLGMRRTMFVVPLDVAATMDAACTRTLAPPERRRLIGMVEEQGIATDGAAWVDRVVAMTLDALVARGEATATQLREDVPELQLKLTFGEGKKWRGEVGISTRILFLLATEGAIVRGRPRGTWLSSQYRWAPTASWVAGGLTAMDREEAEDALVRRWLRTFGPGTETDLKWWTGWGVRQTRAAVARIGAVKMALNDGAGFVLPDDVEPVEAAPTPWVALLPGLDPTVMGWKQREWYLGDHQTALFDRNGNAGPTVWVDGRIVGGWAQRRDGDVVFRLLEDVGAEAEDRIGAEAARLTTWLGETRITPRFRAPLEKELAT